MTRQICKIESKLGPMWLCYMHDETDKKAAPSSFNKGKALQTTLLFIQK